MDIENVLHIWWWSAAAACALALHCWRQKHDAKFFLHDFAAVEVRSRFRLDEMSNFFFPYGFVLYLPTK